MITSLQARFGGSHPHPPHLPTTTRTHARLPCHRGAPIRACRPAACKTSHGAQPLACSLAPCQLNLPWLCSIFLPLYLLRLLPCHANPSPTYYSYGWLPLPCVQYHLPAWRAAPGKAWRVTAGKMTNEQTGGRKLRWSIRHDGVIRAQHHALNAESSSTGLRPGASPRTAASCQAAYRAWW